MVTRSEFIADSDYNRAGGCFVTTRRAIMFFLLAVCLALVVAGLMYFYGPTIYVNQNESDLETLINQTISSLNTKESQLPEYVKPLHYRLRFKPDLRHLNYTGHVTITLQPSKYVYEIILHSENIVINQTSVALTTTEIRNVPAEERALNVTKYENINLNETYEETSTTQPHSTNLTTEVKLFSQENIVHEMEILAQYQEKDTSFYVIKLKEKLNPSLNYTLDMSFLGNITEDMKGFYIATYKDIDGSDQTLATTEFEPIYARRVFPCFDEPKYKASFEISVARPTGMVSLSNMPRKSTELITVNKINLQYAQENGHGFFHFQLSYNNAIANRVDKKGWVWDHFRSSPPMSTYSVSFTIFNYKFVTASSMAGPILTVWAPEAKLNEANYILKYATKIVKYLQEYLITSFPLNKIDFVVIPNFIKESAENWGLIYISDEAFAYNITNTHGDPESRSQIIHTIAHDLSHQWFGNLVTMKWWSDIWLNEGLATYFVSVIEEYLEQDWEISDHFAIETSDIALTLDKLITTHRLSQNITTVFQIEHSVDELVQKKGSCLMRMLNSTISEDMFKKGLQTYLKNHAYNLTTEDDFWNSFPTGPNMILPNVPLKQAMASWTKQNGFPLVTIIRNYTTGDMHLTQQKFLEKNESDDTIWYIPLSYTKGNQTVKTWMADKKMTIKGFTTVNSSDWVIFNVDQAGFYRVNYDLQNWNLLIKQLQKNFSVISLSNRAQIIDDAFELAENGVIEYKIPIKLLKYLSKNETQYAPWASALANLELLEVIFHNTKYNGMFQAYIINLVLPQYTSFFPDNIITYNSTTKLNDKQLMKLILKMACAANFKPCLEWSQHIYKEWMTQTDMSNPIPHIFRDIVYCTAIKIGGMAEWEFLWNKTRQPMSSGELKRSYSSLGCSRDPWIINNYLGHTLDDSIPIQNIPDVWQSIKKSVGLHIGFKYLRLYWVEIKQKFGQMQDIMQTIFDDFLSSLSSKVDLEDLTLFYRYNSESLKFVSPILKQSVDKIKLRMYWWEKHMANITGWLNQ